MRLDTSRLNELRQRRDKLATLRASGARAVQHGEKRLEFRSDAEIVAALSDLDRQIAEASGQRRHSRIINLRCRKGY